MTIVVSFGLFACDENGQKPINKPINNGNLANIIANIQRGSNVPTPFVNSQTNSSQIRDWNDISQEERDMWNKYYGNQAYIEFLRHQRRLEQERWEREDKERLEQRRQDNRQEERKLDDKRFERQREEQQQIERRLEKQRLERQQFEQQQAQRRLEQQQLQRQIEKRRLERRP